MPHAVSLISTLAAGFGLALVFGFIAARCKLPALIGYLVAGIVIGPATPGFVADAEIAAQLAEIGVMLLMFGVGLHFSLADLLAVRKVALPGAVVQMAVATALGCAAAMLWGWSFGAGLVFGLALSVASTVVLLKALESRGRLDSGDGRIAIGWLVVEDLAMVVVLVVLPPLAGALGGQVAPTTQSLWWTLGRTVLEVGAFVALMLVVGRRLFPWVLWQVTKTGSRELFTLAVIVAAVSIAYGSSLLFGVSFALGAFFAGMVLRESQFSHRAAEETLPLRDAFAVLFFVSVGMLFDPTVLVEHPLRVLEVVLIIVFGKSVAAAALVLSFGYPLRTALTVSAGLGQIGEFSFILAALGVALGLLPVEGQSLIVAGALISIALNPLFFELSAPLGRLLAGVTRWAGLRTLASDPLAELPMSTEAKFLSRQVVLVGYGRVGRSIASALRQAGVPFVVADENREAVEQLRAGGTPAVFGNATDPAVLIQAHIAHAHMLVIATPETIEVRRMAEIARTLNPAIRIAVRSHNVDEARLLEAEGTARVFVGETELANAMVEHVLGAVAAPRAAPSRA
ncbi:YbaL family putative K(+) efflux transporter [Piscinibacter koreensis]|uniref:Kef family K(+) transporter n=1 Tax=Piscinibacter koreensis TaxID=2742824 RepID=A0A7Y6TUR8_9BURK|nr:YbaL family putative K(+) efflux transporter [Schlegelella koreensis]NUZ04339.1 Kef family K(+) transporter [Schlegelella koreensis]